MDTNTIMQKDGEYIAHTYARNSVAFVKGRNATLFDAQGKEYIDFSSGIGVNSIGASDEEWAHAVCSQANLLSHVSNLYYTEPQVQVAQMLCEMSGMSKVFFGNSGAEANECAIKAARKYSFDNYGSGRNKIITLTGSFHGRTVTTLAATGQEHFHEYFFPFTEGFIYTDTEDFKKFTELCDDNVCAVMMEGIQGEGGVTPLKRDFVKAVCDYAKSRDILVIFDEVQTGIGRTGKYFCYQQFEVQPDIVSLAKGLGGGLPIGAVMLAASCADTLQAGHHGSTFGGNPVVCAGAKVVLERLSGKDFLPRVLAVGERICKAVCACSSPKVAEVRGMGLMIGIELRGASAKDFCAALLSAGLVTLTAGKNTLRLLPPLTISDGELEKGLNILTDMLKKI